MHADVRRKSHSFCKAQIRLYKTESEPRWASLSSFDVTPVPPIPISRELTVIFDIVEYIIKKVRRVLLASLSWSSMRQKRIHGLKN